MDEPLEALADSQGPVTLYRATARRLRAQAANAPPADIKVPSPEWSAYVEQCEAILQEESSSWVAKFGKP